MDSLARLAGGGGLKAGAGTEAEGQSRNNGVDAADRRPPRHAQFRGTPRPCLRAGPGQDLKNGTNILEVSL